MQDERRLGFTETLLHLLHHVTGLIVLQVLHVRGPVSESDLRQALATMQSRHPVIQCHIRLRGIRTFNQAPFVLPKFAFVRAGTTDIPLDVVEADWQDVMSRELSRPIRGRKVPRMRVTLVRDVAESGLNHIVICADHATIDAKSINLISGELLERIADGGSSRAESPSMAPLPPALEDRLPPKPRLGRSRYQRSLPLPNQHIPGLFHETRLIKRRLDQETTQGLKARIKAHHTTLHGALAAACLLAERAKFGLTEATMLSTVDLRRLCRPPMRADVFGCYIDILRTRHAISHDIWPLARELSFRLINTLARDQANASILRLWGIPFYLRELPSMLLNSRRMDAVAVTTAGESDLRRSYGTLELEDVSMAVSLSLFGPSIFVIASEREAGIDLSIGYSTGGLRPRDAEDLVDHALLLLEDAVATRELA